MIHKTATEYYKANCARIRDDLERVADDHYQSRINALTRATTLSQQAVHQQAHGLRSIRGELYSARLSLVMIEQCILQEAWWAATHKVMPSFAVRDHMLECYHTTIRDSLFNRMFAILEHSFRHFVRLIDPLACKGGTGSFYQVRNYLLERLSAKAQDDYQLLSLSALVRNTIHNDGLFYPDDNKRRTISYKGVEYEFNIAEPVAFATWEFIVMVAEDIATLLYRVVTDLAVVNALKTVE